MTNEALYHTSAPGASRFVQGPPCVVAAFRPPLPAAPRCRSLMTSIQQCRLLALKQISRNYSQL